MKKRLARLSISAAAVLVLAAGCSSGTGAPAGVPSHEMSPSSSSSMEGSHSSSTHSPITTAMAPDSTQAAELRAALTSLLNDHVWLAGNALDTAVKKKGDLKDPQVVGAVDVGLGKGVAQCSGGSSWPQQEADQQAHA